MITTQNNNSTRVVGLACLTLLLPVTLVGWNCKSENGTETSLDPIAEAGLFNLAHLDHLGEEIPMADGGRRIIHIYSEAPDYEWVGDDDEGIACVDDAARAAVVYLRHFELTGDQQSRLKAEALLRFLMDMQTDDGLFFNFILDNTLQINRTHRNSVATEFGWWASRAVWALGVGARVLRDVNEPFSRACAERVRRTLPHLRGLLSNDSNTTDHAGRAVPLWLVYGTAADATSEMLMGLAALEQAYPDDEIRTVIERFAEGLAMMQYGSVSEFPYGAHASFIDVWHGWGNSQTQALSEAGIIESATWEAENFYPRLLVTGWLHSFQLDDPDEVREFEQIAYAVRGVTVGLIRLSQATGDKRYAKMAGLAASWFTGNNVENAVMYDPPTGRGFDGINGPSSINKNSGAESTIEALFSILEVEQIPEARQWLFARGSDPVQATVNEEEYLYRVFTVGSDVESRRLALVINLTRSSFQLLEDAEIDHFTGT